MTKPPHFSLVQFPVVHRSTPSAPPPAKRWTLAIHLETPTAILASPTGNRTDARWLPRSQITIIDSTRRQSPNGLLVDVDLPEWLATEKGFKRPTEPGGPRLI